MEKELEKLQRQLAMAIKERRYARMAELQRKIAALQNVREHVPLSFLLPKFTPQEGIKMCDEISLNAQNVIYRYVRKETKKQEP